jgi:hypothetical protein
MLYLPGIKLCTLKPSPTMWNGGAEITASTFFVDILIFIYKKQK